MANYISERGIQILNELKDYLNKNKTDKKQMVSLVEAVPGSRSFFGYLKYQLLEKEASFKKARQDLVDTVNNKIEEMSKLKEVKNYFFDVKDADCLAYMLNDLGDKKPSGTINTIKKYIPAFLKQLMQPGGVKRYLGIILILAIFAFMITALVFSLGFFATAIISGILMFGLNKLSNSGKNSDSNNPKFEDFRRTNPEYLKNRPSPDLDTTHEIASGLGPVQAAPEAPEASAHGNLYESVGENNYFDPRPGSNNDLDPRPGSNNFIPHIYELDSASGSDSEEGDHRPQSPRGDR